MRNARNGCNVTMVFLARHARTRAHTPEKGMEKSVTGVTCVTAVTWRNEL